MRDVGGSWPGQEGRCKASGKRELNEAKNEAADPLGHLGYFKSHHMRTLAALMPTRRGRLVIRRATGWGKYVWG